VLRKKSMGMSVPEMLMLRIMRHGRTRVHAPNWGTRQPAPEWVTAPTLWRRTEYQVRK